MVDFFTQVMVNFLALNVKLELRFLADRAVKLILLVSMLLFVVLMLQGRLLDHLLR